MRTLSSDTFGWVSDNFASQTFNHQPSLNHLPSSRDMPSIWICTDHLETKLHLGRSQPPVFFHTKMSVFLLLINKSTIKHLHVLSLEMRVESLASHENLCLSQRISFQSCHVCKGQANQIENTKRKLTEECILSCFRCYWVPKFDSSFHCCLRW